MSKCLFKNKGKTSETAMVIINYYLGVNKIKLEIFAVKYFLSKLSANSQTSFLQ